MKPTAAPTWQITSMTGTACAMLGARACQETEGSSTNYAYVRADASGTNTFDDHWHGKGAVSADPSTPTQFFYLRDSC